MKKALMIVCILVVAVISTGCINNMAVQELNNKAAEFMQKGDYESAISRLQASLDLDSSMYQTYYNLGVAATNANKYQTAVDALEKGIKIKPDFYDFYYTLGVAQIGLADEIYEKATVQEEASVDTEKEQISIKRDITDVDKSDAIELKKSAVKNLKTYLDNVPDVNGKDSIEEMIKQSEEFISIHEKTQTVSDEMKAE